MIDLTESHTLADFNRDASAHVKRLKETVQPEVLTVNGEAELVVQSAEAYQKLLDAAELTETLPLLRKSLAEADAGKLRPADAVFDEIVTKYEFKESKPEVVRR